MIASVADGAMTYHLTIAANFAALFVAVARARYARPEDTLRPVADVAVVGPGAGLARSSNISRRTSASFDLGRSGRTGMNVRCRVEGDVAYSGLDHFLAVGSADQDGLQIRKDRHQFTARGCSQAFRGEATPSVFSYGYGVCLESKGCLCGS